MTCPQIYIGTGRASSIPALPADYTNDSIILTSYDVTVGMPIFVQVVTRNHGTDAAPATDLELYWTPPGTFVAPVNFIGTKSFADGEIPNAVGSPPSEGMIPHNFGWTPPTIGHFCLLARLKNTVAPTGACLLQQYPTPGTDPTTDPLQGIHNVNVLAPPAPKKSPPHRRSPMWFAFAAGNSFHGIEDTKLTVRVLDPHKDRERLEELVSQRGIDNDLSRRNLRFHVPNGVQVAEGRERVILPASVLHRKAETHVCVPQISRLGEISAEIAPHLIQPGSRLMEAAHGPIDMKLLQGEQRQTLVQVEPGDHDNAVYAIDVSHHGADGRVIGGLVVFFVPPHNYF